MGLWTLMATNRVRHTWCAVITCGEPEVPPGGYVVGYDFNVHSKIEFHCEPGYLLTGQSLLECTSQGEWSGSPPACQCKCVWS